MFRKLVNPVLFYIFPTEFRCLTRPGIHPKQVEACVTSKYTDLPINSKFSDIVRRNWLTLMLLLVNLANIK